MSLRHGVRGSGGADIPEDSLDQAIHHGARGGTDDADAARPRPTFSRPTFSRPTFSRPTFSRPTFSHWRGAMPAPGSPDPGPSGRAASAP
jgi:hypothetical protein